MTKVALIGLDAAIPTLVQKYFSMGKLPNLKKLADGGTWSEIIPAYPTHTAANWNTVSTGTWPKTHGVTDMVVHLPGTDLTEIKSGFYSDLCQAEQIWRTAERFDKRCILLKFIGSWPPNVKKSIQIEGFGAPGGPGSRPWGASPLSISNSSCHCSEPLENAVLVDFVESKLQNWKNLPNQSSHLTALESEIKLVNVTYNVLLLAIDSKTEYDTALFAKDCDAKTAIILKKNQLSEWLTENFKVQEKTTMGAFRMKLMDIGMSGKVRFKLFVSQIFPTEGWSFPDNISKELLGRYGPFLESISHFPYVFGWIDEETYLDDASYQAKWMGNATKFLMSNHPWDLYMTQWHGIDNTQHAFLRFDKSVLTEKESQVCDNVVLKTYEIADELVGDILQANKNQQDSEIYTIVVSDHGHVMGKRRFFINAYLYQKGFIKLKRDNATNKVTVDWENTLAFSQGMVHIYVNLKGRDPHGCVNPGKEYDDVVQQVIDALYDVKDPKTGMRPIALALSNQDAEFIGLSGQRAGDIVFAANPVYAGDNRLKVSGDLFEDLKVGFRDASIHGAQLPSLDMGEYGTIKAMLIANGPKIKKGHVRKSPINMIDIAPTISHILNIPVPKNCEGRILYDLFE